MPCEEEGRDLNDAAEAKECLTASKLPANHQQLGERHGMLPSSLQNCETIKLSLTDNQQGPTVQHRELCSMLCGSLDGRGVWGRIDMCICMAVYLKPWQYCYPFAVYLKLPPDC